MTGGCVFYDYLTTDHVFLAFCFVCLCGVVVHLRAVAFELAWRPIGRSAVGAVFRRCIVALSLGLLATPLMPQPMRAGELPSYWRETYAGADVSRDVWLLYSGVTLAPTSDIYSDGIRLRASGGYGQYRYSGHRSGDPPDKRRQFRGTITYVEALIGYQKRIGELTAKAFVGVAAIDHTIAPGDPIALGGLLTQGMDYGLKGALELWLNLGSDAWTSLDASWTGAHQTYAGRWRMGYRVLPTVSIGMETGINGHTMSDSRVLADGSRSERLRPQTRVGAFARYEWNGGEISVSGGVANSAYDFSATDGFDDFYGTVNWLMRF